MDLIASKDFKIVGSGRKVKDGERFSLEPVVADVYLRAKLATIAPPQKKAMVAAPAASYLTRALDALGPTGQSGPKDLDGVPVKRPRGRPRKAKRAD